MDIVIIGRDVRLGSLPIWNVPMRASLGIVLTAWLTSLFGQPAFADKRVALVIGNSAYQNVAKLGNPANDAAAMFKSAGFNNVESRLNLTANELRKTLREFGCSLREK